MQRATSKEYWLRSRRKPLESFNSQIKRDPNLDATLYIDPRVYVFLIQHQLVFAGKEIAGFGIVENGIFDWVSITSAGGGADVKTSTQDGAWSEIRAVEETGRGTNLQIHSHPGLSCFWSGTDTTDQYGRIDALRDFVPEGEYWFVVFDTTNDQYLSRRVEWDKDSIRYNDGDCWLGDRKISRPGTVQAALAAAAVTSQTVKYGSYQGYQATQTAHTVYNGSSVKAAEGGNTQAATGAAGGASATQKQLPLREADTDQTSKASKKKDEKNVGSGGSDLQRQAHSGSLATALYNYVYLNGARPGFDHLGNWAIYQAILDVYRQNASGKPNAGDIRISDIARELIVAESKHGKVRATPKVRSYLRPRSLCMATAYNDIVLADFLYTLEKTIDKNMYAMTPEEALRLSVFDADKNGLSYAYAAEQMTVYNPTSGKRKLDDLSVARFLGKNATVAIESHDEFFAWLRTHDHEILRMPAVGQITNVRKLRMSPVQASISRMELIEVLVDILNGGSESIAMLLSDPTISNFELFLLRRCLSTVDPMLVDVFDSIVKTETEDGQAVEDTLAAIQNFCKTCSDTEQNPLTDIDILGIYDEIARLSVDDIVKLFALADELMKGLTVEEQWALYLLFTAASGLIPTPLIIIDYIRVVRGSERGGEDDALLSLLSLDIGRFAFMALQDLEVILTNEVDEVLTVTDEMGNATAALNGNADVVWATWEE